MSNTAVRIGAALVLVVTAIGLADYFLKERPHQRIVMQESGAPAEIPPALEPTNGTGSSESSAPQEAVMPDQAVSSDGSVASESPVRRVVKKGTSTRKKSSIDVHELLATLQFIPQETQEESLLSLTAQGAGMETVVLLKNNDRAALFSWIESADAKSIFASLKQALQEKFSPKLQNLVDETQTSDSGPPVDVLSFFDTAISPEKVMFIRVRNRLYEFHVTESALDSIRELIAELSK